jgi:hypothetical protein
MVAGEWNRWLLHPRGGPSWTPDAFTVKNYPPGALALKRSARSGPEPARLPHLGTRSAVPNAWAMSAMRSQVAVAIWDAMLASAAVRWVVPNGFCSTAALCGMPWREPPVMKM